MFMAGDSSDAQALRLYVHNKVSLAQAIPVAYGQKLALLPGVKNITIWQWFGGSYKDPNDQKYFFARYGVDPSRLFDIRSEMRLPDDEKQAFEKIRTACIVDRKLASRLGMKVGDKVTLVGDAFPVNLDLTLVGIYDDPDQSEALLFNDEYLREAIRSTNMSDQAGAFLIQADSKEDVDRVIQESDQLFANSASPTKTETESAYALGFVSFLGNLKLFLVAIAGAVSFTILLVSANTIAMSVRERTREVGILKTLGFDRGTILVIILGEALLIGVTGGIAGVLFAGGLCGVVRENGPGFIDALQKLSITPGVLFASLGLATFIALGSALFPAWKASRTPILDALRFVD
jgi:putative ABC transport system permease protein